MCKYENLESSKRYKVSVQFFGQKIFEINFYDFVDSFGEISEYK